MSPTKQSLVMRLERWCCRHGANIHISQFILNKLVRAGSVKKISDLYYLTLRDFTDLRGVTVEKATEAFCEVRKHESITLKNLIFGIGVPYTGISDATALEYGVVSVAELDQVLSDPAYNEILLKAYGKRDVGRLLRLWYASEGVDILNDVRRILRDPERNPNGFITVGKSNAVSELLIKDRKFYVLGSYPGTTVAKIRQLIKDNGGKWVWQYSKKVDVVVCGAGGHGWVAAMRPYKVWGLLQLEEAIRNETARRSEDLSKRVNIKPEVQKTTEYRNYTKP